ncbi:uncharacterized protein [Henckelia pumila]|uniref:uncharacterized protein n=1 Tax=Henckelia pumila TaxID=405737 RepID=UPI003C6E8FC5
MHFFKPKIACRRADEYELLHEIGRESYGRVYQAREKKTGQIVAIKKQEVHASSLREIDILRSLVGCPWFVEFKQVVVDGRKDLRRNMDGMAWAFAEAKVRLSMVQGPGAARSWSGEIFICHGYVVRWVYYGRDVAGPSAFKGTSEDEQLQMILTKHVDEDKFLLVSEEGIHLLKTMLDLDPHSRITADQALHHECYTSIGSIHDTVPNAQCHGKSSNSEERFKPDYLLQDGRLERAGRPQLLPWEMEFCKAPLRLKYLKVFIYGWFGPLLSDVTIGVAKAFGVRTAPDEEFEEYLRHLIDENCTRDRNEMA